MVNGLGATSPQFEEVKQKLLSEATISRIEGIVCAVFAACCIAIAAVPFSVAFIAPHLAPLAVCQAMVFTAFAIQSFLVAHELIVTGNNMRRIAQDLTYDARFANMTFNEIFQEIAKTHDYMEGTWVCKPLDTFMTWADAKLRHHFPCLKKLDQYIAKKFPHLFAGQA